MWFEMHKHTQYSMFDGFDRIKSIVAYAKELGMPAIGISDHGNASGILQLYMECKKQDIKPLMGCEVYFQPTFNTDKPKYHLCIYAINEVGYRNLCQIISVANEENFFRTGIVTFDLLAQYSEGIVCTSACVGGFIARAITDGNMDLAVKAANKFKSIFDDNFYLEIQPIKVDEEGMQENVNVALMKMSTKLGIKCVMTTDSHFTEKSDFDTYMMMHRLGKLGAKDKGEGFSLEHAEKTYCERYMHSEEEIRKKFLMMHGPGSKYKVTPSLEILNQIMDNMQEIYDKIDIELSFEDSIPMYDEVEDTYKEAKRICIEKLKATGRYTKEYIERTKYELDVIKSHDLCDYFLIVRDYVVWAKERDIYVGPGRGSVGGSLVAELLDITDIDAIVVGTDFDRFLRADKKKMPDIDLDFENGGQKEVIQYLLDKYKGHAAQILTFGYYKSSSLVNDLCKVYGIEGPEVHRIKAILSSKVKDVAHFEFEEVDYKELLKDRQCYELDQEYDHFVKHFAKLTGQVRYYGQHPAGVVVTKGPISNYIPITKVKGQLICSYDKYDIEAADMLKFDILGLRTLNVLHDIERSTGDKFNRRLVEPSIQDQMYENFKEGRSLGIFQLNKKAAQDILIDIGADNIQDVIAAISCNRPGTLKLGMHKQYGENKIRLDKSTPWYKYTDDAYGSIIYQEHVMRICRGMAQMEPGDVDKLMKFKFNDEEREILKEKFVKGAVAHSKVKKSDAMQLFDNMALYMFNKGHGAGYALISEWQMYHKVKHPLEFWYSTIKWENDDYKKFEFLAEAAADGTIFFLPHVNYTAEFSIRTVDGEKAIQMGYNIIKNVGEKAAEIIQAERDKNGPFKDYDDFYDRCKSRSVTSRVIESLHQEGALEFNKKKYISRVTKFNSTLYMKGARNG
jgi:DNA polymerase-3 subunit alpha